MPQSRMHGVSLTRADGKYALIDEDAGAVYFDEHACWVGYHTLGDDPKGIVDAEEWIDWGVETLYGTRENHDGADGSDARLQMSFKYKF